MCSSDLVHRNVANVVHEKDDSIKAALDYAINVLKVKHVVVCGHTRCGGVTAAMQEGEGVVHDWIRPIKTLYKDNQAEIQKYPTKDAQVEALAVLSIQKSLAVIQSFAFLQKGLSNIALHGWLFRLETGLIEEVV